MPRSWDPHDFAEVATEAFGYLIESGFVAVRAEATEVRYGSRDTGVGVYFDPREGRVLTLVDRRLDAAFEARALLTCLYVAAGLGPAQDVRDAARSGRLVGPVVASQAGALRRVLPHLSGAAGDRLLRECHGS